MRSNFILVLLLSIIALGCKRQQAENPADKNIQGLEEAVEVENSINESNSYNTSFSDEVLDLNNQATMLMNKRGLDNYNKALSLLDKAIGIDSNYYTAYSNKVTVLIRLKDYNAAIETCEYLVTSVRSDLAEGYMMLGLLYDKRKNKTTADIYYNKAIKAYAKRIKEKNNVLDMVNKAQLTYILEKEKGLNEIDSLIKAYPADEDLPMYKEYLFLGYNHQKALDDL